MNSEIALFIKETLQHFEKIHPFPADLAVLIDNFHQDIFDHNSHRFSTIHYLLSVIDRQRAKRLLIWPCSEDGYVDFARGVCTYVLEFNRGSTTVKIASISRSALLSPTLIKMRRFLMDLATVALKCRIGEVQLPLKENVPDINKRLAILDQKYNAYKAYAELEQNVETPPQFQKMEKLEKLREADQRLQQRMVQLLSLTPISLSSTDNISDLSEAVKSWASKELAQDEEKEIEAKLDAMENANSALNELTTLCRSLRTPIKIEKSKLIISLNTGISDDPMEISKISLSNVGGQRSLSDFYAASLKNIAGITNMVVHSTHMGSIKTLQDITRTLVDLERSLPKLKIEELLKKTQDYLAELTSVYDALPKIPLVYTYTRPGIVAKFPEIKKEENLNASPGDDWAAELEEELRTGLPFSCNGIPNGAVPQENTPTKNPRSSARSTIFSRTVAPNSIWQLPLSSSSPMSRAVNEAADDESASLSTVFDDCNLDVSANFCCPPNTEDNPAHVERDGFDHLDSQFQIVSSDAANDSEIQPSATTPPVATRRSIDLLVFRYKNLKSKINQEK